MSSKLAWATYLQKKREEEGKKEGRKGENQGRRKGREEEREKGLRYIYGDIHPGAEKLLSMSECL